MKVILAEVGHSALFLLNGLLSKEIGAKGKERVRRSKGIIYRGMSLCCFFIQVVCLVKR